MWVDELLTGYQEGALEALEARFTTFPAQGSREMVTLGPIPFSSLCAHHLLPFVGEVHIGYLPNEKLAGLSKLPRAVKYFSRMLQTQEFMTTDLADFLDRMLEPKGLIVLAKARHYCMELRGVEVAGVVTKTSALRGLLMTDASVRAEALQLLMGR